MGSVKKDEMEKFDKLVKEYNCTKYSALPKFIRRRVDALKKILMEQVEIQQEFHKELHELELKYEKLYAPLYEKRAKIINGEHEPNDEECKLPESLTDITENGDQENMEHDFSKEFSFTEEEEKKLSSKVKGIPGFWLGCFASTFNFNDSIEPYDRPVLKYLKDIKLSYGTKDEFVTYRLDFVFDENPFFTNNILTKTYYLKTKADEKDPFSYEGFEVCKSVGCEINWNQGKNITKKTTTVKQKNKKDGRTREKKKEIDRDSFFFFFKPPESDAQGDDFELDEEFGSIMAVDFELGEVIRQSIIPSAPLYYDGYMMDEEDEDDDDEEEDDDEVDSDDIDDSDSDGDNSESEENESNDSLNGAKNSK